MPNPEEQPSPNYVASLIDAKGTTAGIKIIPAHIESFSNQGSYTKVSMISGKTWYIQAPTKEIDAAIKAWYTRVATQ